MLYLLDDIEKVKPDFSSDTHDWWFEETFERYHKDKLFAYIVRNKKTKEMNRVLTNGKEILYETGSLEAMSTQLAVLKFIQDNKIKTICLN